MSSKIIISVANNQGEEAKPYDKGKLVYLLWSSEEKIGFKKVKFKSDILPEIIQNKSIQNGDESFLEEIFLKIRKKKIVKRFHHQIAIQSN